MGEVIIRLIAPAREGVTTSVDGHYVRDYDPILEDGQPFLLTDPDPRWAKRFPDLQAAWEAWRAETGRIRPDGKPDRPLTAWTVEFLPAPTT